MDGLYKQYQYKYLGIAYAIPLFLFKIYQLLMTSCILTIIKNEHEYLDEWIKYHLDLGINHIFIFEDYDSLSHSEICNKYKNKVSLNNIFNILDHKTQQQAKHFKLTKKISVHHLYIKYALSYLKKYSDIYDWCFCIDNDEFIILENNINNILELYKDYDAFTLSWKCFGANGLINKPDYAKKSIIEIYTKESDISYLEKKPQEVIKTCYKLNKFNDNIFCNTHYPSNNYNWCNAINEKSYNIPIYKNIYINHYITRSWEEYVWKVKKRGYMWGLEKNYNFFFKVNPDMNIYKEQLINNAKNISNSSI